MWNNYVCITIISVVQYVGMYENDEYGRMEGTLKSLNAADPNFGEVWLGHSKTYYSLSRIMYLLAVLYLSAYRISAVGNNII